MVDTFTELVGNKIEEHVPEKSFKINCLDNEFTTPEIKRIKRKKQREYTKHGNTQLFKTLKKQLKETIKNEGRKFVDKQIEAGEKTNKWIQKTSSILARPRNSTNNTFELPEHVERGLSELESAEEIADFFSKISQEYDPLCIDTLPSHVQVRLATEPCDHPSFEEHQIYKELKEKLAVYLATSQLKYWMNSSLNFVLQSQPYSTRLSLHTSGLIVVRQNMESPSVRFLFLNQRMTLEALA